MIFFFSSLQFRHEIKFKDSSIQTIIIRINDAGSDSTKLKDSAITPAL